MSKSSHFDLIGSAGKNEIRTFFETRLVFGIPCSRWGASPFVAYPFDVSGFSESAAVEKIASSPQKPEKGEHPIFQALRWRESLEKDSSLTKAEIARKEGLTRARVTQVFHLLELPTEVQAHLKKLTSPDEIRHYSIRKLLHIVAGGHGSKMESFEKLKDQFSKKRTQHS